VEAFARQGLRSHLYELTGSFVATMTTLPAIPLDTAFGLCQLLAAATSPAGAEVAGPRFPTELVDPVVRLLAAVTACAATLLDRREVLLANMASDLVIPVAAVLAAEASVLLGPLLTLLAAHSSPAVAASTVLLLLRQAVLVPAFRDSSLATSMHAIVERAPEHVGATLRSELRLAAIF
jgi:hypothetical protein